MNKFADLTVAEQGLHRQFTMLATFANRHGPD